MPLELSPLGRRPAKSQAAKESQAAESRPPAKAAKPQPEGRYCFLCDERRPRAEFAPSRTSGDGLFYACRLHFLAGETARREAVALATLSRAGISPRSPITAGKGLTSRAEAAQEEGF